MFICACLNESKDGKGWAQTGAHWVCPKCQADPQRMIAITADPKVLEAAIIKKDEEKLEVIKPVFKTSDGEIFETENDAGKHILKIKKIDKLHKLINDPVHFTNIQLGIIIDRIDDIYELIKS